MLETLPLIVVLLTALYLFGLGLASLVAPARAANFLLGFTGSAFLHYIELLLRLAVGGAFLVHAPYMASSDIFTLFGWILIITTACLFAIPWRWHHRFAQMTVPRVIRYLRLIAVVALAMGSFILAAVFRGDAVQ